MPRNAGTEFDGQRVVLTAEGRRRLEARLQVATAELEELNERLQRGEAGSQALDDRARVADRVSSLQQTLRSAVDVHAVDEDPTILELGDEVDLEYDDGERESVVLVHPVEVDATHGHVSIDSPLARALLGQKVGNRVQVQAPGGTYDVEILDRRRAR